MIFCNCSSWFTWGAGSAAPAGRVASPDGSTAGLARASSDGSTDDSYEQQLLFLQQIQIVISASGAEFAVSS